MEHTMYLLVVAVFAMPALVTSSWVSEGHNHLVASPVVYYPLEHAAPLVSYQGPVAVPVVLPSGHLADTPEVSHAKHHHLSAVAQAKADQYYKGHSEHGYGGAYGYTGSYHGYAVPVVLPNGHIADTHEVATAKSAHLLAVAKAKADKYYAGHGEGYGYAENQYGYSGSVHGYGIPVVLPSGHVADTHEVAAAKSAHLLAVAHAKEKQAYHYYDDSHSHYDDSHSHYDDSHSHYDDSSSHYTLHQQPYHHPIYVPNFYDTEALHGLQYLSYHQ